MEAHDVRLHRDLPHRDRDTPVCMYIRKCSYLSGAMDERTPFHRKNPREPRQLTAQLPNNLELCAACSEIRREVCVIVLPQFQ